MEVPGGENDLPAPILPQELERAIFELAAYSCPPNIPIFMLTAWRVKHWLEPLLYRVACIYAIPDEDHRFPVVSADVLLRAIANKRSCLLHAVEYFFLGDPPTSSESSIVDDFLSACPRITHLFSSGSLVIHSTLEAVASLHCLHRLTLDSTKISQSLTSFAHPLFRNVTHLELLDIDSITDIDNSQYASLALVPNLTHISFNYTPLFCEVYPLLANIAQLQCIVLLSMLFRRQQSMPDPRPLDDRFVHIGQTDFFIEWLNSAHGRRDYWGIAEALISARRSGRVPPSLYSVSDVDMSWRA
ncbi:hypothetical protein MSAN_01092200 [Mycena sanguinolenta]|uniref:Uncharacterized protein n=1 Tax=Mycena sanguinolenta TaxID=230812 RepID=A0A8H6YT37_9AGAR|nr:hypothetical protein MSAN_01092200 [Mycena sanguinolenta]